MPAQLVGHQLAAAAGGSKQLDRTVGVGWGAVCHVLSLLVGSFLVYTDNHCYQLKRQKMSTTSQRKLLGFHARDGSKRDQAIMEEIGRRMAQGASKSEAVRRLCEDGIKWRKERG